MVATTATIAFVRLNDPSKSPQAIARAYLDALVNYDCDKLGNVVTPQRKQEAVLYCRTQMATAPMFTRVRIDQVSLSKDKAHDTIVIFTGKFERQSVVQSEL